VCFGIYFHSVHYTIVQFVVNGDHEFESGWVCLAIGNGAAMSLCRQHQEQFRELTDQETQKGARVAAAQ